MEAITSFFSVYGADIGTVIAFLLTLCVLSYALGDNALFRLAVHILIGVSACFVTVAVFYTVVWNQLVRPLVTGALAGGEAATTGTPGNDVLMLALPLLLGLWMVFKASPRLARWGNPMVGYVVGVGAAVAIGGAVTGTILPQASASVNMFAPGRGLVEGSIILVATVTTLAYFQFSIRTGAQAGQRPVWLRILAGIGQFFIAITFGALFAGAYAAALAALIERLKFIWYFFWDYVMYLWNYLMHFVRPS